MHGSKIPKKKKRMHGSINFFHTVILKITSKNFLLITSMKILTLSFNIKRYKLIFPCIVHLQ